MKGSKEEVLTEENLMREDPIDQDNRHMGHYLHIIQYNLIIEHPIFIIDPNRVIIDRRRVTMDPNRKQDGRIDMHH